MFAKQIQKNSFPGFPTLIQLDKVTEKKDIKSGRVYDIQFDFSWVTNLFGFSEKTDFEIDGHLKCNFIIISKCFELCTNHESAMDTQYLRLSGEIF